MSEKKEKKWRFNIIDVLVIVVLLAAIFVGTTILNRGPVITQAETRIATAVVEITNAEKALIDSINVGDSIFLTVDNVDRATVVAKTEATPNNMVGFNQETNAYEQSSSENSNYSSFITIEAEVTEDDANIYAGSTPLKVGRAVFVKGKGYSSKAYVLELETRAKGE